MKTTKLINVLILAIALVISFSACKKATQDFVEEKVPADNASITGTLAGKINHDELDMSDKASCTFDRFPWTVAKISGIAGTGFHRAARRRNHGVDCHGNIPQIPRFWRKVFVSGNH